MFDPFYIHYTTWMRTNFNQLSVYRLERYLPIIYRCLYIDLTRSVDVQDYTSVSVTLTSE
jgi:hypothetical protein